MSDSHTSGVMLILAAARAVAEDEALNEWLFDIHYKEVMQPGIIVRASRLHALDAALDQPIESAVSAAWITLYETERGDAAAAWKENTAINGDRRAKGVITPISPYSAPTMMAAYKRIAGPPLAPKENTRLYLQLWDSDTLPLSVGAFWGAASVFESERLAEGHPRWLAIGELNDLGDGPDVTAEENSSLHQGRSKLALSGAFRVVYVERSSD